MLWDGKEDDCLIFYKLNVKFENYYCIVVYFMFYIK